MRRRVTLPAVLGAMALARLAHAQVPEITVHGELPCSLEDLTQAVGLRWPAGQGGTLMVRVIDGSHVEVAVGERQDQVELHGETGGPAARLIAVAAAALVEPGELPAGLPPEPPAAPPAGPLAPPPRPPRAPSSLALGLRPAWGAAKRYGGVLDGTLWLSPRWALSLAVAGGWRPDAAPTPVSLDVTAVVLRAGVQVAILGDGVGEVALRGGLMAGRYQVSGHTGDSDLAHDATFWGATTSLVGGVSLGRVAIIAAVDLDWTPRRDVLLVDGVPAVTMGWLDVQVGLGAEVRW